MTAVRPPTALPCLAKTWMSRFSPPCLRRKWAAKEPPIPAPVCVGEGGREDNTTALPGGYYIILYCNSILSYALPRHNLFYALLNSQSTHSTWPSDCQVLSTISAVPITATLAAGSVGYSSLSVSSSASSRPKNGTHETRNRRTAPNISALTLRPQN